MHEFPLITLLAAAFTAAWLLGLLTQALKLSPIVGYLLAGVAIGPYTPGFVGSHELAPQLAELGVILLMFGVGLHFHLKDLIAVRFIAIPGALGQSLVATLAGGVILALLGWPFSAGLVVGMAMAVASTVVLMRVLMDSGGLNSPAGHAAVGWLIVEDVITVIILVLLPALAPLPPLPAADPAHATAGHHWAVSLLIALGKLSVLVAIVLWGGSKVVPWILVQVARLRSRELFTLTILVLSIAVATGSAAFFGASAALGAFLAGMVVAQSPVSQQAGADALPLRDAFAVLFFVSVGMLFDPSFIIDHPLLVAAGLTVVLIAKPLAALLIVALLGYPARTALIVAVGLAQIGEFSFILGELAKKHRLITDDAQHLLVACSIVSITINPLLFRSINPFEKWLRTKPRLWALVNGRSERRTAARNAAAATEVQTTDGRLAIVVGFGPVGRQVDRLLRHAGFKTVVIELNMDAVTQLNADGRLAIFGDATRPEILQQAGITRASHLVLTASYTPDRKALLAEAKELNPDVRLLIRTHYLEEEEAARQMGADSAVVDEVESAVALTEVILAETGADPAAIREEADRVRSELSSRYRPSHA